MKISKNLAKWAYAWNYIFGRTPYRHPTEVYWKDRRKCYPQHISLCPLFWRTFVVTPAMIATGLAVSALALVGLRDYLTEVATVLSLAGLGSVIVVGVVRLFLRPLIRPIRKATYGVAASVSPVFSLLGKVKKTLCPIFDVEK